MSRARATDAERAYWKKIEDANALLEPEFARSTSMDELFERMERIRQRLGSLAGPVSLPTTISPSPKT